MRVSDANQLLRRHHDKRIGAVKGMHCLTDGILNGSRAQPLSGDNISNRFCIAGGMENCAAQFQRAAQFRRIAEVAIVRERHPAFLMIDLNGLAVVAVGAAGGAVSGVRDRHCALRQA